MNQYNEKNVLAHWSVIELIACSCSNALEEVYMNGFLCVWFVVLNFANKTQNCICQHLNGCDWSLPSAAGMSLGETTSDSAPFFSDDSEAEEQGGPAGQGPQEEPPSGVSEVRARLTVFILCYINLLNYMDRFTVAGTARHGQSEPPPPNIKDLDSRHTVSIIWFRCFGKTGNILIRGFKKKRKEGKHLTTKLHCYFLETWILLGNHTGSLFIEKKIITESSWIY